jgi:lipopolysaccharide transport system ATP-binding protein
MSDVVIRAEKLGKKFVIGHRREEGAAVFVDTLAHGVRSMWRKGFDMLKGRPMVEGDVVEEFWALRDVDFEIRRGEVVSIIGHNGAGKTTLLKILSRITEPTEGRVEISGRVASLLEVGTGFHPELSGRENVFLNGAILGMTQAEVRRRFDEIVEFSGVEKFLDTPVKRYSVGMYARLAFAVAAHLESEILVVDEVLAVGDAEFQERCLNRMSEVATAGRTVLFVSHNLAAVTALTRRAIVFQSGRIYFDGAIEPAIAQYATSLRKIKNDRNWGRGKNSALISASLVDQNGMPTDRYEPGTPLRLRVVLETSGVRGMSLDVVLRDEHNLPIAFYSTGLFSQVPLPGKMGRYECNLVMQPYQLASGEYCFDLSTVHIHVEEDHRVSNAVRFLVERCSPDGVPFDFSQRRGEGAMAMRLAAPIDFSELPSVAGEPTPESG